MAVGGPIRLPAANKIASKFVTHRATTSANALKRAADSVITNANAPLILQGWIHRKPKKLNKNLTFANIRDPKGDLIQVVDKNSPSLFKSLKPDSTVSVTIKKNGEDLECEAVRVLGEANLVPGELQAEKTKEWPAKYRYIQLREPSFQKTLRSRAAIIRTCRSVLDEEGFTEIETPILFKSTPEGAREFLVPSRRKGFMYALPQSPQQYKQLLIASGIDRYYQVAKCFRDEDLRADRQPEFTQLDIEMAFVSVSDVQKSIEKVVTKCWRSVDREIVTLNGKDVRNGFAKLTYAECIANYGIDKPDLRWDIRIHKLEGMKARKNSAFPIFEVLCVPKAIRSVVEDVKTSLPRVTFLDRTDENQLKHQISQLASFSEEQWPEIYKLLMRVAANEGDLLAFGDRQDPNYENPTPLGRLRQVLVNSRFGDSEPESQGKAEWDKKSIATWVEKFPSFEPQDTGVDCDGYPQYNYEQLKATHHPFTMVDLDDYIHLENGEPLKCHGMHFDLVIDGTEVGGGSQRIHDSDLQRYVLKNVVGVESPDTLFGHLLEALATGCPPHAGFAIGLDRMVAMLLGLKSIRDVIAFPKSMAGTDPVVGSPSKVTPQQLSPYSIKVD